MNFQLSTFIKSELVSKRSVQLRSHKRYAAKPMLLLFKHPPSQRSHAQKAAIATLASPLNQRSLPLATAKPTLKQRRLQR
ncbi:hypothetical protein E2C01_082085 [Portunus trituberculatus]|uniref:Uncharacterized protein n=1 Tax=Portunus trituberculatus TaxID=210409 RepID=A0A5B7J2U5_PORTR|nr:hypothetical protein [Portunus trituberculatus]